MSYEIKGKVTGNANALREEIRREAGKIVMTHALGMATALYQVYPVGPPHTDGTPHTRDTFAILNGNTVVAEKGQFAHATKEYALSQAATEAGDNRKLKFIAAGAAFFVELGTIYMDARPIIRQQIKLAQANITKDLRQLNLKASGR